jgi:hypothetical protein
MTYYYVVKNASRDWHVKLTRFGCNSEIIETFTCSASARAYARKLNKTLEA